MASREDDILVSIVTKVEGNGEKELKELGTAGEKSLNKITAAANRANAALAKLNAQQERAGRTVDDRGGRAATTAARIAAEGRQQADNRRKQAEADKKAETATAAAVTAAAARTEARERAAAVRQEARDKAAAARQEAKDKAKQERAEEKERVAVDRRIEKQKAAAAKEAAVAKAAEIKEAAREKTVADRKAAKEKAEATRATVKKPDTKAEAEKKAEIAAYEKGLEEKRKLQAADQAKMDAETKRQDAIRARRATERAAAPKPVAAAPVAAPLPQKELSFEEARKLALQNAIARNTGQTLRQVQDPAEIARKNENRRKADEEARVKLAAAKQAEEEKAEAARVKALAVQTRAARLAGGGGAGGGGDDGGGAVLVQFRRGLMALRPVLGQMGGSFGALTTAMSLATLGVTALAAALTTGLVFAIERAGDSANDTKARLGAFTGGLDKGEDAYKQLQGLAEELGSTAPKLAKPFEQLIRMGSGAPQKELVDVLGTFLKGAQADRVPEETALQASSTFFESLRKGFMSDEDLKKLEEAMPSVAEALAKSIKKTAPGVLEAGVTSRQQVVDAAQTPEFKSDIAAKFKEAGQLTKSIPTAFTELSNAATRLLEAMSGSSIIISAIETATSFLKTLAEKINEMSPEARGILGRTALGAAGGAVVGGLAAGPVGAGVGAAAGAGAGALVGISNLPTATGDMPSLSDTGLVTSATQAATGLDKVADAATKTAPALSDSAKIQKELNAHSAQLNKEKAKIDLNFVDQEQASIAQHNEINVERADQAYRAAKIGKQEASKQLELARLAPQAAAISAAGAALSLEKIQDKQRALREQGGPREGQTDKEYRQEREQLDIEEAQAKLALKRAQIDMKYSGLDEEKAKLAFDKAETDIRSAALEASDASLKLAKDAQGRPISRDLAMVRYAQAQLDAQEALGKIGSQQLSTLGEILAALKAMGGGGERGGRADDRDRTSEGKFDPDQRMRRLLSGRDAQGRPDVGVEEIKNNEEKARINRAMDQREAWQRAQQDAQQRAAEREAQERAQEQKDRTDRGLPPNQTLQEILDEEKENQRKFNESMRKQGATSTPGRDRVNESPPVPGRYIDGQFVPDKEPPAQPEKRSDLPDTSTLQASLDGLKSAIEAQTQQQSQPPPEPPAPPAPPEPPAPPPEPPAPPAPPEPPPEPQQPVATAALESVEPAASSAATGMEKAGTAAGDAATALGGAAEAANRLASAMQPRDAVEAATGGLIKGPGTSTSDSIHARLSRGEFVQSAKATQYWGVDFMRAINNLRTPRFNAGGLVGVPRFAEGGLVDVPTSRAQAPAHLGTVDLRTDHGNLRMIAPPDAATQLQRLAVTRRTTSTGTKPGFVG